MTDYFSVAEVKKRGPERHIGPGYNFAGPGTEFRARMKGSDFYENMMKKAGRKVDGIPTKLRSLAARAGFEGKIAIESLGLVRKGSFASGGDRQSTLGKRLNSLASMGKKYLRGGHRKGLKLHRR